MAPVHLLHALQRSQNRASPTVEQAFELAVGEVAQFPGDDGAQGRAPAPYRTGFG